MTKFFMMNERECQSMKDTLKLLRGMLQGAIDVPFGDEDFQQFIHDKTLSLVFETVSKIEEAMKSVELLKEAVA